MTVLIHTSLGSTSLLGRGKVRDLYAVEDALLAAGHQNLHLTHLAVSEMPGSGTGEELLAWAGIDSDHIAVAARKLVGV